MGVALHGVFYSSILVAATAALISDGPAAKASADLKVSGYEDPKTTYRIYIEAVRKNDPLAAKKCWVIDDDNKSGALDVIVGMWISIRQLNQVAVKKFDEEGFRALPEGWRRDDVTDQALDLTKKRLDDAEVKISGDTAELKIKWKKGDGSAFQFGDEPIGFRKVDGKWKIDANKMTGLKQGKEFFGTCVALNLWEP